MINKVVDLKIKGVKLFELNSFNDSRGSFSEIFLFKNNHKEFKLNYVQENESISKFGVFRGMHFQKGKYSQSKLIRVVNGSGIDFICDLRKSSKTYKELIQINLDHKKLLFIPKGLAHGFLSLSENTILNYKCDNYYNSKYESGFNIFDKELKSKFPIHKNKIIQSSRDKVLPSFNQCYKFI